MNIFNLAINWAINKHGEDADFNKVLDYAIIIRKYMDKYPARTRKLLEGK